MLFTETLAHIEIAEDKRLHKLEVNQNIRNFSLTLMKLQIEPANIELRKKIENNLKYSMSGYLEKYTATLPY